MPVLNNRAVADKYDTGTSPATIFGVYPSRGGWFIVGAGAGVFMQLQYGSDPSRTSARGAEEWTDEMLLGGGAVGGLPPNCVGVRFRNAIAGQTATVTAVIFQGPEAVPSIQSFGGATTSGGGAPTTVSSGQTAGTNGTPTALHSSIACQAVVVKANPTNSGNVYVGGSGVTTTTGFILKPDEAVSLDISNVASVFFDVDTTGAGVSWLAVS